MDHIADDCAEDKDNSYVSILYIPYSAEWESDGPDSSPTMTLVPITTGAFSVEPSNSTIRYVSIPSMSDTAHGDCRILVDPDADPVSWNDSETPGAIDLGDLHFQQPSPGDSLEDRDIFITGCLDQAAPSGIHYGPLLEELCARYDKSQPDTYMLKNIKLTCQETSYTGKDGETKYRIDLTINPYFMSQEDFDRSSLNHCDRCANPSQATALAYGLARAFTDERNIDHWRQPSIGAIANDVVHDLVHSAKSETADQVVTLTPQQKQCCVALCTGHRIVVKRPNAEGIYSFSELSVGFDESYERSAPRPHNGVLDQA